MQQLFTVIPISQSHWTLHYFNGMWNCTVKRRKSEYSILFDRWQRHLEENCSE